MFEKLKLAWQAARLLKGVDMGAKILITKTVIAGLLGAVVFVITHWPDAATVGTALPVLLEGLSIALGALGLRHAIEKSGPVK